MYMYAKENDMSSESSFSDKCAINNRDIHTHTFCQGLVDLNLSTLWGWRNMFKTRYEN